MRVRSAAIARTIALAASALLHVPVTVAAVQHVLERGELRVLPEPPRAIEIDTEAALPELPAPPPTPESAERAVDGQPTPAAPDASGAAVRDSVRAPVPAAARAGRVLTAEGDSGDSPLDFTMVQGDAPTYVGGVTSSAGTSEAPVYDSRARGAGRAASPATPIQKPRARAPRAPERDLSRPASPRASAWSCGFPLEADAAGIHYAVVRLIVRVSADGRALAVTVLEDPGYGFGAHARRCAFARSYLPAHDARGRAITKTTAPIAVRFTR